MFRKLHAHEIEMRVQKCKENGSQWLLYKDARADMVILDETVGPDGWQRDHKELKNVIYCGVGVDYSKMPDPGTLTSNNSEWVWKWDAGTESFSDKQKGEASDSFKRACVNHGIGRELYTPIFIWIPASMIPVKSKERDGKKIWSIDSFNDPVVTFVEYNDRGLIKHLIVEHDSKEVFRFPRKFSGGKPSEAERNEISESTVDPRDDAPDPPKKAAPKPADKPKPNTTSSSSDNAGIQKLLNVTATDKWNGEWETTRWMFKPEFEWLIMHDNADDIKKVMDHFENAEGIGIGNKNKEKLNKRISELICLDRGISTEKVDMPDGPYANEQEMEDELDDLPF